MLETPYSAGIIDYDESQQTLSAAVDPPKLVKSEAKGKGVPSLQAYFSKPPVQALGVCVT